MALHSMPFSTGSRLLERAIALHREMTRSLRNQTCQLSVPPFNRIPGLASLVQDRKTISLSELAMNENTEVLTSLNSDELRALAESNLAPTRQGRLDELLNQNREGNLDESETKELDDLLVQVDYLNILKARAQLTLNEQSDSKS